MSRKKVFQAWMYKLQDIIPIVKDIAHQGFTAIQTSPIQPLKEKLHDNLDNAWVIYQPIDFTVANDLGTAADIKALADECHKYNLKLIVDIVFHHLANDKGNDVSSLVPGFLRSFYKESFININDYSSEYQCTHYSLDGLPALNLENGEVIYRQYLMLETLHDLAVDGVRVDAFKHITKSYRQKLADKLQALDMKANSYGEVIYSNKAMQNNYSELNLIANQGVDREDSSKYISVVTHDDFGGNNPYLNRDWNIFFAEYGYLADDYKANIIYFARPDDDMWKAENIRNINRRII